MRKRKGAQGKPAQAISGAKSGNPYLGDPVAGLRGTAFPHRDIRIFLNKTKLP